MDNGYCEEIIMSNFIVVAVLIIILLISLRESIKHFKGEGGCCGGGGSSVKEPDKKLDGPVIKTKVFKIEGMHCENCANRVKRAINRTAGVSAKVNLRRKEVVVSYDREVDDEAFISDVEALGYKVRE